MKKNKIMLFAALAALLLTGCGKKNQRPNFGDNEYPVIAVGAQNAQLQIRPKVSGFITRLAVQEGQAVGKGQLLFVVDNETFAAAVRQAEAAVKQAQASVASAEAQLATATLTYQNSETLFKNKVNTMETARAQVQQTKSAVASAQAALANARQNLNFCYVTAPTAGVVGNLPYKQGALVSPSSTPAVTTVSNISTVEVYFSMTEKDILAMTKNAGGMKAAVSAYPPVKLRLADGTDYRHTGTVTKVSGLIDPATGSVSMIARFPNPDHLLKSGGSGSIIVPKTANNSIIIPQSLTAQVQDKIFVYKVDGQNKVHYTEITVSPNNDGKSFIVTSGLKVGDKIVSAGITKLNDGMEIKPITEAQYQKKIKEAEKLGENQADAAKLKKALGM